MQTQQKSILHPFSTKGLSNDGVQPIMVVYQLNEKTWRAFAHPYGETTEAVSKKTAIKKIRDLTAAYQRIVEEYKNPTHLVHGGLDELTDRKVFAWVFANESLLRELHSTGKADTEHCYVEAYRSES